MKILMLTPYLPYPLISGGQIRSYNLLKSLAEKHHITLISLIKHENEKQYIKNISSFCEKVIVAKRPEKPWTLKNILKTGFGKYPFLVVRNFSQEAKQKVVEVLTREKFDLIHAETFYVMPHIPKTSVPILLVEQTVEYLVYKHFADHLALKILKWLFAVDVFKIQYWEEHFWKKATRVVAMSEADKFVMQSHLQKLNVSIIPNGIDANFFSFKKPKFNKSPKILFVGNFKWLQNKEAVMHLVKKIWPLILNKLPNSRLWIVGRFPTHEILSLQNTRISISENVSDIRDAYKKSDLLLAPIFGPGGTRYKILEAMASGVPIVTTSFGIEGLDAKDGKEAIVRNNNQDLAEAAVKVLKDIKLYSLLSINANKLVRLKYNWASIANDLDALYEEVAHG